MQFQRGHICRPRQRPAIIDQDIINVRSTFAARHWECLYPARRKSGCILFIEGFAVYALWITLQRDRPITKMRQ